MCEKVDCVVYLRADGILNKIWKLILAIKGGEM